MKKLVNALAVNVILSFAANLYPRYGGSQWHNFRLSSSLTCRWCFVCLMYLSKHFKSVCNILIVSPGKGISR